jgi:hypothetical protein
MVIGLTFTGRWTAARMMPPVTAGAEAGALAPALAGALGAAALALGDEEVELQAARTMPIEPIDSPTMLARWMNSRRLSRPAANASTTSSCRGPARRRTLSNWE